MTIKEPFITSNSEFKKKSKLIATCAIAAILLITVIGSKYIAKPKNTVEKKEKITFSSAVKFDEVENTKFEDTEKKLSQAELKSETIEKKLLKESESNNELKQQYNDLKKNFDDLKKVVQNYQVQSQEKLFSQGNDISINANKPTIQEDKIDLIVKTKKVINYKNPDNYVPAGSFAQAVMIGGADASAAVNAQSNPTPMLFRIIDNGTLPNHAKSHLNGCFVTAAVAGDISSERGVIRLEKLSCTKESGWILDTKVEGTVYGPEGKNGVRGIPVWREGALLQRAFVAGSLSGFSDAVQQKYTTNSISPLGTTQTVQGADVVKYGLAGGGAKAMDKLADYNIQRAEQYHPVIQLSAGTIVDVVFLNGFYLDGQKHDENDEAEPTTVEHINNLPFAPVASSSTEQSPQTSQLPLTPAQIERLKAHESELGMKIETNPAA